MKKSSIIILLLLFISAIWTTGEFNLNQIVITFIIYFALFKILMRVLRSLWERIWTIFKIYRNWGKPENRRWNTYLL